MVVIMKGDQKIFFKIMLNNRLQKQQSNNLNFIGLYGGIWEVFS